MPVINIGIKVEQEGEGGMEARKTSERAVKGVEGGSQGEVEELLRQESTGREMVIGLLRSFSA